MQPINPTIIKEVTTVYREYKRSPDYSGYTYINRISDLVMQDPEKYPVLAKMKPQGMRAHITRTLNYSMPFERIRDSSSGRGTVLKERS